MREMNVSADLDWSWENQLFGSQIPWAGKESCAYPLRIKLNHPLAACCNDQQKYLSKKRSVLQLVKIDSKTKRYYHLNSCSRSSEQANPNLPSN
jgi:hypothetical protein